MEPVKQIHNKNEIKKNNKQTTAGMEGKQKKFWVEQKKHACKAIYIFFLVSTRLVVGVHLCKYKAEEQYAYERIGVIAPPLFFLTGKEREKKREYSSRIEWHRRAEFRKKKFA